MKSWQRIAKFIGILIAAGAALFVYATYRQLTAPTIVDRERFCGSNSKHRRSLQGSGILISNVPNFKRDIKL